MWWLRWALFLFPALAFDWFRLRSRLTARVAFLASVPPVALGLASCTAVGVAWSAAIVALPTQPQQPARTEPAPSATPLPPTTTLTSPTATAVPPATATATAVPPQPTPTNRPATIRLRVGEEGHINGDVFAAVDDPSWDAMWKAINARDQAGLAELMMRGKVFTMKPGTRVLVLENAFASVKVRALDGPSVGKAGWIPYEYLNR